jgi:hypothetical protein
MDPSDSIQTLAQVQATLRARGVRLVSKGQDPLQRAIDRLLRLVSLGRMDRYLSSYVTTIGRTIYVPDHWERWPEESRVDILRHELVHVAQFARYGLVPMAIAYLLLPLPLGLAWARMRLEREAYEETLRCAYARGGRPAVEALRGEITRRFTGPDYLWMWPWPGSVGRWFDGALSAIEREHRGSPGRL